MNQPAKTYDAPFDDAVDAADFQILLLNKTIAERDALIGQQECEIAAVRSRFRDSIATAEADVARREADLMQMIKLNQPIFFGDMEPGESARVDLPCGGALLCQMLKKVIRRKGMLERLKEGGYTSAVKVAESVDWDTVEEFSNATLELLGTKRKVEQKLDYELPAAS